jgi:hypothetical protein
MNKIFSILLLIGLYGCAASVSTEQYVGEYEKHTRIKPISNNIENILFIFFSYLSEIR